MERSDESAKAPANASIKETVSVMIDGEADPGALRTAIAQLSEREGRQTWDLYHQIGDAIRNTEPGPAMRADFGARFAERFASEPVLLPARRSLIARLGAWPTTIAAVAAAGLGFFIAPTLMRETTNVPASATVALTAPATSPSKTSGSMTSLAAASGDEPLAYIALHHRAHASLYGTSAALRPAVLETKSQR